MTNPHILGLDELAERELNEAARLLAQIPSDPAQDLVIAQLQAVVAVGRALLYLGRELSRFTPSDGQLS